MTVEIPTRSRPLLDRFPALRRPGWLPKGLWPELSDLAKRHEADLASLKEAESERAALRDKHEAEDAALMAAMKDSATLPEVTDEREREAASKLAGMKVEAAKDRLAETVDHCLSAIAEGRAVWEGDLDSRAAEAERKREEARRVLAQADFEVGAVGRTRNWLARTAERTPRLGHIGHDQLGVPTRRPDPDLASISGWGSEDDAVMEVSDA